jgi:hypothetical protein
LLHQVLSQSRLLEDLSVLALHCVIDDVRRRPTSSMLVQLLESALALQGIATALPGAPSGPAVSESSAWLSEAKFYSYSWRDFRGAVRCLRSSGVIPDGDAPVTGSMPQWPALWRLFLHVKRGYQAAHGVEESLQEFPVLQLAYKARPSLSL